MSLLPALERLLGDAAERLPPDIPAASSNGHLTAARASRPRPGRGLLGRPRRRLLALATAVALIGTGGALAATAALQTGAPVTTQPGHPPISTIGEGTARPGAIHVVSMRVADPAGGPVWGVGVFLTTTGLACPVTGRLVNGRLGVLGIDYAFHDDGRFHPLLAPAAIGLDCAPPDARGRLFLTGQTSIVNASGDLAPEAAANQQAQCDLPGTESRLPRCPQATLRTVYYGFLGPKARAVSYVYRGRLHVQRTSGPNGAYLVVLPAPAGSTTGRRARTGGFKPGPTLYATYSTGRICAVRSVIELVHPSACQLVGYVEPRLRLPTRGRVRTAVRVRLVRDLIGDGTPLHVAGIAVSFRAPIAIATTRAFYVIELRRPATVACEEAFAHAKTFSPLTQHSQETLHAGQRLTIATPLRPFCPGRYTGRLAYAVVATPLSAAQEITPMTSPSRAITAATFSIDVAAG